jgi:hypothetical protein
MRSANGSLEFLLRISRHRRSAHRGVKSISEYVEQCASLLTPEHLDEVRGELPTLNVQFAAISVRQFPHLQQQLKLLTDFLEDTAAGVFPAGSEASRKETAFALRYMAREADIIPDSVPQRTSANVNERQVFIVVRWCSLSFVGVHCLSLVWINLGNISPSDTPPPYSSAC